MNVARRIITTVLLTLAAVFLAVGVGLGLALDPVFLYANGGVTVILAAVWSVFRFFWWRTDERRRTLLATGVRVPASLVSTRRTATQINERHVLAHTFESRATGQVIRAVARTLASLPVGTEATIAFDAANPANATVVEDFSQRYDQPRR